MLSMEDLERHHSYTREKGETSTRAALLAQCWYLFLTGKRLIRGDFLLLKNSVVYDPVLSGTEKRDEIESVGVDLSLLVEEAVLYTKERQPSFSYATQGKMSQDHMREVAAHTKDGALSYKRKVQRLLAEEFSEIVILSEDHDKLTAFGYRLELPGVYTHESSTTETTTTFSSTKPSDYRFERTHWAVLQDPFRRALLDSTVALNVRQMEEDENLLVALSEGNFS